MTAMHPASYTFQCLLHQ